MPENTTVVVNEKPAPQAPIDESVKIPDAVKRRSAAVDEYFAAQAKATPSDHQPTPPPSPPDGSSGPSPVQPPSESQAATSDQPPSPSTPPPAVSSSPADNFDPTEKPPYPVEPASWEHKYLRMQGRYNDSQKAIGEMQHQMEQMGEELMRTQAMLQKPNGRPPRELTFLTEKDLQDFGPDVLDLAQRAARHAMAPDMARLQQENADLRDDLAQTSRATMFQTLDALIPNWRDIDRNPRFAQWLKLPDMLSRRIRGQLLNEAMSSADAHRVASFFRGFIAEEQATGHTEPPSLPHPASMTSPREPAIPLATLAAPGRPRPASGSDSPGLSSADKPTYTRAQIAEYYRLRRKGGYDGRETEANRIEADIFAAQREGRIRN